MPDLGGSAATVDDQIQAAYNAYSSQGLSASGLSKNGLFANLFLMSVSSEG